MSNDFVGTTDFMMVLEYHCGSIHDLIWAVVTAQNEQTHLKYLPI
jgi:hypothetical protein